MMTQILTTKLYIPPSRPAVIARPALIERLNRSLHTRLTLISAPAGFGKTTLVSEWVNSCERAAAWFSLDEQDNDPNRFLAYFIAALQTIVPNIGDDLLRSLSSPQPPAIESLLTTLVNMIATISEDFLLVLDDYHIIESSQIDKAIGFLLTYMPPQMHMIMTTREDPQLPLARLRARGQLTELRATDLRFATHEISDFLGHTMGLDLSEDKIVALEQRTEGWIVGLHLAAVSLQSQVDTSTFIDAFTGSHQYILDYLVEEVLHQQSEHIQSFLLQTSILDRFCANLCEAVTGNEDSQDILLFLKRANLFLTPLDHQQQWFRYHHLFSDLLRQRLQQSSTDSEINILHTRASHWYEDNGFEIDAFQHAAAAHDIQRAEWLITGVGVPLYFRGLAHPVLHWLEGLPADILDMNPSLQVMYCWSLKATYQNSQIETKLKAVEAILQASKPDDKVSDLIGQIAAMRAMLAANTYETETIVEQSELALELLHPDNVYVRTVVMRTLAIAYQFRGERAAAREAYVKTINMSEASDNVYINILATTGLGIVQLSDNQLRQAEQTFKRVLDLVGEPPTPIACAAYLRLGRIYYEWNDLEAAQEYGQVGVDLARQIDTIDSAVSGEIFLTRLKIIQSDLSEADAMLLQIEQEIQQKQFEQQIPVLIEAKIRLCLEQNEIGEAYHLAMLHDLLLSQARVFLAQAKPQNALDVLTRYEQQEEEQDWVDVRLKVMLLQALAYQMDNQLTEALRLLQKLIRSTKPEGFIRLFVDEGEPMKQLLSELSSQGFMPDYTRKLLNAFDSSTSHPTLSANQALIEPLSERELEILQLVAEGLSNREISERLYLALSTIKGHNRNIYGKLGVSRRTEAVALARELGLLQD